MAIYWAAPPLWLAEEPLDATFARPLPGPEMVLSPGLPASGRGFDGPADWFGSVADLPVGVVVLGEGLASGNTGVLAGTSVVAAAGGVIPSGDRGATAATSLLDSDFAAYAGFGPLTICPSSVPARENERISPSGG